MTKRTKPKASGLVLVSLLTSHKWPERVSSGRLVCRCHVVFLRCCVCLVLFCFVFVLLLSLKPRPLVQSFFVLRYVWGPTATRVSSFFFFFFFRDAAFSEYFCTIVITDFLFVVHTGRPGSSEVTSYPSDSLRRE